MADPITSVAPVRAETSGQRLRASVAAQRREQRSSANRLRDGLSLAPLRATSGPPAGTDEPNAATVNPDRGRRSASLFDAPNSGRNLVSRLRAQIRPSSPLNALGTDTSAAAVGAAAASDSPAAIAVPRRAMGALSTPDTAGFGSRPGDTGVAGRGLGQRSPLAGSAQGTGASGSPAIANALRSSLRTSFLRSDGRSRLLLSLGNANRSDGGFGLAALARSAFDLIG